MKKLLVLVLICLPIIILSSCSQREDLTIEKLNPKLVDLISDTYVDEIRYKYEDFQKVYALAKKYGINNPYLPTRGVGTTIC